MGLLWDLMQNSAISRQRRKSSSQEGRITELETEVDELKKLLKAVVERLERRFGEDLDRDGKIG